MKKDFLALFLVLFFVPISLDARPSLSTGKELSANELVLECTGKHKQLKHVGILTCGSYLSGIIDSQRVIGNADPTKQVFCTPKKGIAMSEAIAVVVHWIQNKMKNKLTARDAIIKAYRAKYPCNKKSSL